MDLRDSKRLPPAYPNSVHHDELHPCRLLDLPLEIRLMIYGYAIGYHNVSWTMLNDSADGCLLVLDDTQDSNDKSDLHLHRCPVSLLRTCRSISQEAYPFLYSQTRFDVRFRPYEPVYRTGYRLQILRPWSLQPLPSLAQVILRRVEHVRVLFQGRDAAMQYWGMYLLSKHLESGRQLKSLRLAFSGVRFSEWLKEREDFEDFPYLGSYQGNAKVDFCDSDPTDEDIAQFKERLEESGQEYSISITKKSDDSSRKKDWWAVLDI